MVLVEERVRESAVLIYPFPLLRPDVNVEPYFVRPYIFAKLVFLFLSLILQHRYIGADRFLISKLN